MKQNWPARLPTMQDISPLALFIRKSQRRFIRLLGAAAKNTKFRRAYAIGCVVILFASVVFWAVLGARLQRHNADQLSDPYMFANWATFHGASFPGSHTFLLKWPIFWLLSVVGISAASLLVATVGVVVVTVAALVAVLYRIDRRPLVFGTVCLGLALALLLIPAQPYAGGLLPVNMAMLTTRNLEYAVYLAALILFARANRFRSRSFVAGVLLLSVLIASDKLFLSLSAGGALLALIAYSLISNWSLTTFAVRWLAGSIMALVGATAALLVISASHLTHLAGETAATPYGVVHSGKNLVLGVSYAVLGLFTNSGANPAYDNKVLSKLPGNIVHRFWSFSGLAYLVAIGVFLLALIFVWRLLRSSLQAAPRRSKPPVANLLALSLIWSTVVAVGVFVVTDHYYAVDARYLTISLFALVVSVSVGLRRHRWPWPEDLLLCACTLLVAIALAAFTALHINHSQTSALSTIRGRNRLITQTLQRHKVDVLVGDYWRVLPIKLATHGSQNTLPLSGCTEPAGVLTSSTWQPNLAKHSFAYLVTLNGSLTNFPGCSLQQITAEYGAPNATQVIAGTVAKPTEALLFYDRGSHPPPKLSQATAATASILPVGLTQLAGTNCTQPTTMNIVAHQDDDLLFMNPDLLHDIQSGRCVRTVFLTAGDGGRSKLYWLSRQLGSEAAYSTMLGTQTVWDQQTVELTAGEYVTVASPHGNPKVSLIFFNLPDGNLQGQGFGTSAYQSLAKLHAGSIPKLKTVDGQSAYTSTQLTGALDLLMDTYQPAAIHTQADVPSTSYPDHSDHIITSRYAQAAAQLYDQEHFGGALAVPVVRYIGYPIHGYGTNVSGTDLSQKQAAFLAYAQYDGTVCDSMAACDQTPTYGAYLTRQYTEDAGEQ